MKHPHEASPLDHPAVLAPDTFYSINGYLYVKASFVLANEHATAIINRRCACVYNADRVFERFRWSESDHVNFQIAAHAIGIRNVTPKQIGLFLLHIGDSIIGSHLQKYRLKIIKKYKLRGIHYLYNHMFYSKQVGGPAERICERWANDAGFQGFSRDQISVMVR